MNAAAPSPSARPPVFAALGDPTRLALVERLRSRNRQNLGALASGAGMSRQAVSKHLGVLAQAGIVRAAHVGRETVYELDAAPLAEAAAWLDQFRQLWEERLDRLEAYLETYDPPEAP